ncbi:MAG TPA: ABC transporter permease [Vicinamibacterales bacterium]|nr:ABC transporter permease [Vicinamibacterales bacterium]
MEGLVNDVRYAIRRLASAPGFTAVAALTLGLGIGANTAIYSVVDALMLRPLPYRDPARLVDIAISNESGISSRSLTAAQYLEFRAQSPIFDAVEAYMPRSAALIGSSEPQILLGIAMTGGVMRMLGVPPQIGRGIDDGDAVPGRDQVVVLSDELWRRQFDADPAIVGNTIRLSDKVYDVIGVMPPAFNFPWGQRHFWVPLPVDPSGKAAGRFNVTARVRGDLSVAQAQLRLDAVAPGLEQTAAAAGWRVKLDVPIARHLNPPVRRALYVLAGAVSLVLLIACANLANLLLVQGAARGREIAVRTALGATRGRLMRQLLTETVALSVLGGALGLLAAQWAIELLAAFTPREMTFLNVDTIRLDARVIAFAVGITGMTALTFGLLPAFRSARALPQDSLKETARSATGTRRQERVRRAFVLVQLALSLMLLVGAGLLTRTFTRITRLDPGFDPHNLLTVSLSLPRWKYPTRALQQQFYDGIAGRLRAAPGVVATTITGGVPPRGGGISFQLHFEIEGRGIVLDDPNLLMPFSEVDGDYFSVMRIPLRDGRTFSREDTLEAPRAIIIGEAMARRLWKGDSPIGERIRWDSDVPWHTVVGVVGDVYQFRHDQPRDQFALYYPNSQSRGIPGQQTILIRATGDPAAIAPVVRSLIREVDPDQPLSRIETVDEAYREFFATPRFYAFLMTAFALVGLAISAVGLYGVLAYAIAQRTREFGIRMALGAQRADVLRLVLGSGAAIIAAGVTLGAAGSLILSRALESLLVDVQRTDIATYALVSLLLATIALIACWVPARRATLVDPVTALRLE